MMPARCDSAGGAVLNDFNRWLQDSVFKPLEDKKMPVMEHLVELQVRLTRAVIATAVVPVLPKPVAVVAENPPVPSVVLASDVVAVALVGWAVLPLVSRVALAFVPESEAQELTQPAQPRHQKSV